jgi:hypothetical protein
MPTAAFSSASINLRPVPFGHVNAKRQYGQVLQRCPLGHGFLKRLFESSVMPEPKGFLGLLSCVNVPLALAASAPFFFMHLGARLLALRTWATSTSRAFLAIAKGLVGHIGLDSAILKHGNR